MSEYIFPAVAKKALFLVTNTEISSYINHCLLLLPKSLGFRNANTPQFLSTYLNDVRLTA